MTMTTTDITTIEPLGRLAAIAPATTRGRTRIPAPARHHVKLKVDARSTRPGHSATSPTPSTCATSGCTASTRPAPPGSQPN